MPKIDEDIQILLKTVCDHFDREDKDTRQRQMLEWRKYKLLWDGMSEIWYSEVAHDWRIHDDSGESGDSAHYDKPINVFKAYLESIIAALSITIPPIKCYPDDADNPLDLSTAKAGDKIGQLIYRHNDAAMLWLHALFILCTEGMIACYSYPKEDVKYGTYKEDKTEEVTEESYICPVCNAQMADELFSNKELDEFQPDDDDVALHAALQEGPVCPECAAQLDPNLQKTPLVITRIVGTTTKPKSRICIEVYGGLCVKVPNYARKQDDCPYLHFEYETHYSNAIERYPNLTTKLGPGTVSGEDYERWARLNPQYKGEMPTGTVTVRNCWQRISSFNVLNKEDADKLKKIFPDGAKVVLINDLFADAENEALDDYWTLSHNPLSDHLHHDPLGKILESIQNITNELISLILQTIEHGIPQTFADPSVLNFDDYRQTEVTPGGIFPAKPVAGKSIGEAFYEVRTATLSQEVLPFANKMQEMGQLVSGATPSLFGGALEGSRTASQYSMSRAQALQRLQILWKLLTTWWKNIHSKTIPMFIKEMKDDEKNVDLDEQGNFINSFIRKAELEGKIGRVELEANENLPITWAQQKDTIEKLMENQSPVIQSAISSPENVHWIAKAIGLPDFIVPGEDDRQKQYEEIKLLVNSEPIVVPPDPMEVENYPVMAYQAQVSGMPPPPPPEPTETPSVEVDPLVDNHDIEADICRTYLVSESGRMLKNENPMGYKNVLLHMKAHMDIIQQNMMAQQQAAMPPGQVNQPKPPGNSGVDANVAAAT